MLARQPPPDVDALLAGGALLCLGAQEPQPFRVGDEVRSRWRAAAPWVGVVTDVRWSWYLDRRYRAGTYQVERVLTWYWLVEVRLLRSKRGVPIRKRWARRSATWFSRVAAPD